MKTLNTRWNRIQELFGQAADLPPGERDIFLSTECGTDVELRRELNELLLADDEHSPSVARSSPLTQAVHLAIENTTRDRRAELIGTVVGSYRLTAILGQGGAGTVFLGERADRQYSAQVAVKIVENALLNDEVERRFQAERQILANLNHPHIARLLDAGETKTGQPFLVMEYVHGEAIDRYCNNKKQTIDERLKLFVKVCEAVQYAHRNLIVHRDLKPGNILVTPDGTPKLLDFGIAKLLDASTQAKIKAGQTPHTRINDRLLTPEYASPEQILGQTVTTTSDVYALAIVLYELLAGVRPYQVNAVSQLELERSICVTDPLRPSQMVAKMANLARKRGAGTSEQLAEAEADHFPAFEDIIAARGASTKRLQQLLAGDIDAIVMRALRKEPERRYSSVEQLVDDVQRYLDRQPVLARQGNWLYYSKRFVRRHTFGVATGALAVISLIGFAVVMSIQATRIAEQRDRATKEGQRAESVSNFMLEVFTAADPFQSQDKEVTAKELLDNAGQRIANDLNQQPEVRARLMEAIGRAYSRQGQTEPATKYLEDALRLQRSLPSHDDMRLATMLSNYGRTLLDSGGFASADLAFKEARELMERSGKSQTAEYLQLLANCERLEHLRNNMSLAQQYGERTLQLARRLYGNTHPETAAVLLTLAEVMMWQAKYAEAENLLRETVRIDHATLPEKHPDRVMADLTLGELLYRRNNLDEAAELIGSALLAQKAVYGPNNIRIAYTLDILSSVQLKEQKGEQAEANIRQALAITENIRGKNNFYSGAMHSSVASVLIQRKKFGEAEREARLSLEILKATAPPDHQYVASAEYLVGQILVATSRFKEAEPLLRENIARWVRSRAPAWRAARSETLLGAALMGTGRSDEAESTLRHSYEVLSAKDSGADPDAVTLAHQYLSQLRKLR